MTPTPEAQPSLRTRTLSLTPVARSEDQRREWEVSISSTLPVLRHDWWSGESYYEVLEHTPDAVDMTRAVNGLPLVYDHQPTVRNTVGRVVDIGLRDDGKLGGRMYVSSTEPAIATKIDEGILGDVSIGYEWLEYTDEGRSKDGKEPFTRRVTKWRIYEVTLTPVPADVAVGVGRSLARAIPTTTGHEAQESFMAQETSATPAPTPVVENVQERGFNPESHRRDAIMSMVSIAELPAKVAAELIASGADIETAATRVFDEKRKAAPARIELSEQEKKAFSFSRAVLAVAEGDWKKAGFERELSEEAYKSLPAEAHRSDKSFALPLSIAGKRTIVSTAVAGRGPELVREDVANSDMQELLRNASVLGQAGVPFITGITGSLPLPRQIAAATVGIQPQKDLAGADTANSAPQYELVTLTPFTLSGYIPVTRQALAQVSASLDQDMIGELATQHGIVVDQLGLAGNGAGGNPTGILFAAGTNVIDHGANGGAETLALALSYSRELAIDNALTTGVQYMTTPANYFRLAGVQAIAGTDSETLINVETGRMRNGMAAMFTNQLPSNLVKGTSGATCSAAIAMDFARFFRLYFWGEAAEFVVDPYTQARKAIIGVNSYQYFAPFLRIPSAAAVARDITTV